MTHTHNPATGVELAQRETHLPVNECFGPTVQGEGPYIGQVASFLRLGLCNLACTWCDSAFTWDKTRYDLDSENPETPIDTLADRVGNIGAPLVVLTGGEPLMHQTRYALKNLLMRLTERHQVHMETNGTITPHGMVRALTTHFAVSPKLASNGSDPESKRIKKAPLAAFAELATEDRASFKFVATGPGDFAEIDQLVTDHQIPTRSVWVMPEGTTPAEVLTTHRQLADHALARGYNTTTRLHVLLWPDQERGR